MGPVQWLAILVIAAVVVGVARGIDVRIVLFAASLVLAGLAHDVGLVFRVFFETFSSEKFVVPICTAMGFAYVLRHTGCDQHLVRALAAPVARVPFLLVPGVLLIGFAVNIPVISQTSTAVCLGPVVVPLMRAAGFRAALIAATLALGASVGGELLNPGAPELLSVNALTHLDTKELAWKHVLPILVPYAATAMLAFWLLSMREPRDPATTPPVAEGRVNPLKALVPAVPLALLFLTGPPLNLVEIPWQWFAADKKLFPSRLIGAAMLLGSAVAALVAPGKAKDCTKEFFAGAGYGFATIVSLIVTANCFGEAIKSVGLANALANLIGAYPSALVPLAAAVPCGFGAVSGSGMASTQSLYGFFHPAAVQLGADPNDVGAVVSIAAAAGRTMSPVAAVVLMCATLTGVKPFDVVKRVALPLALGLVVVVLLRI